MELDVNGACRMLAAADKRVDGAAGVKYVSIYTNGRLVIVYINKMRTVCVEVRRAHHLMRNSGVVACPSVERRLRTDVRSLTMDSTFCTDQIENKVGEDKEWAGELGGRGFRKEFEWPDSQRDSGIYVLRPSKQKTNAFTCSCESLSLRLKQLVQARGGENSWDSISAGGGAGIVDSSCKANFSYFPSYPTTLHGLNLDSQKEMCLWEGF